MRLGLMGYGVVGKALSDALAAEGRAISVYDPFKGLDDLTVLRGCDIVFIAVWSPVKGGRLDTSHVTDAVKTLMAETGLVPLIVVRSTVTPGVMTTLSSRWPGQDFAFVPEFLIEADPLGSTRKADRIVIGTDKINPTMDRTLVELLRLVSPGSPVVKLSAEEAVMVKLASNGLLAAKVAVANELHDICRAYGIEWDNVRGAVGLDRRIGPDHIRVTDERGYGGSCFPKDVQGLIGSALDAGDSAPIFSAIQQRNTEIREKARKHGNG